MFAGWNSSRSHKERGSEVVFTLVDCICLQKAARKHYLDTYAPTVDYLSMPTANNVRYISEWIWNELET